MKEMQSLFNAPDIQRRDGIRDRAMLNLCFSAGLRVSELVGLPRVAGRPVRTCLVTLPTAAPGHHPGTAAGFPAGRRRHARRRRSGILI